MNEPDPNPWRPWNCWQYMPNPTDARWWPYAHKLVEIKREGEWPVKPTVVAPALLHPAFNVYGLLWRPVVAIEQKLGP